MPKGGFVCPYHARYCVKLGVQTNPAGKPASTGIKANERPSAGNTLCLLIFGPAAAALMMVKNKWMM